MEDSLYPETEPAETEETDSETALVPLSFVRGLKPGDTLTIKVVHLYDDEAEVSIAEKEMEHEEEMME